MLIGSQLKNAQLEVIADIAALPTTDLVIGRIVYVKDQYQLYLYDGVGSGAARWKPIYTKEDVDTVNTATNLVITNLIDGSSNTLDDIDTAVAANAANIVDITDGSDSILANKTPPQEMVVSFSFEGHSLGGSVNNSVINAGSSGASDNLRSTTGSFVTGQDGYRVIPFDFEITGWSAYAKCGAGSGVQYQIMVGSISDSRTTTPLKFKSTTDSGNLAPHFYESFLNSNGEVVEGTAGQTTGGSSAYHYIVPVWNGEQKDGVAGEKLSASVIIYDSTGTAISATDANWGSCYVSLFIRRRTLA
jgi:hypothetical protein